MPPREWKEPKLFYAVGDGEPYEISGIPSLEMGGSCDIVEQNDFKPFSIEPHDFSVEFEIKGSSLYIAVLRSAMPNNWLKMHGIPMRRRCVKNGRFRKR